MLLGVKPDNYLQYSEIIKTNQNTILQMFKAEALSISSHGYLPGKLREALK